MDPSGIDDWADQDLLTKDEARDRLVDEIARTRTRLATMKQPDDHAEIMLLERRLPWSRSAVNTTPISRTMPVPTGSEVA
jgi:hypothetical protein